MLSLSSAEDEGNWRFVFDNLMDHGYGSAELRTRSAVEDALDKTKMRA